MDKAAAIFGSYVDAKFMRGLKVTRVSVDIPIEQSEEFIRMFGTPNGVDPVPVCLARLQGAQAPVSTAPISPAFTRMEYAPETPEPKRERKRSEIAHLRCCDPEFQLWLARRYPEQWAVTVGGDLNGFEQANDTLKRVLGITTRRQLDEDGPSAEAWLKLLASYDFKDRVRV